MCYTVACPSCGKIGWGGCGAHVDAVMRSVPAAERCTCGQDNVPAEPSAELRVRFRR